MSQEQRDAFRNRIRELVEFSKGRADGRKGLVEAWELEDALTRYPDETPAPADTRTMEQMMADTMYNVNRKAAPPGKPAQEPGKLIWFRWTCINGHWNDHANLAPDGTKMCATPGCRAEAEVNEPAPPGAARRHRCVLGDWHYPTANCYGETAVEDSGSTGGGA